MKIVDYHMIGATIRIGQEILCLPCAGFFLYVIGSGPELQDKEEEKTYATKNLKAQKTPWEAERKKIYLFLWNRFHALFRSHLCYYHDLNKL